VTYATSTSILKRPKRKKAEPINIFRRPSSFFFDPDASTHFRHAQRPCGASVSRILFFSSLIVGSGRTMTRLPFLSRKRSVHPTVPALVFFFFLVSGTPTSHLRFSLLRSRALSLLFLHEVRLKRQDFFFVLAPSSVAKGEPDSALASHARRRGSPFFGVSLDGYRKPVASGSALFSPGHQYREH